jgi:hypothetical protein
MNLNEKKMLDILKSLKDSGAVSVKAEFEAEGTRTEELLRLLDIARKADMKIGLKIGGCEAVRDLIEAKQFGVDYVIAPMVETQYALSKYALAINRVFSSLEQNEVIFLANIETITTYNNFHSMLKVTSESKNIDGFVMGRVDFVGSLGKSLDSVDEEYVLTHALKLADFTKEYNLDFVVGGGVSKQSVPFLSALSNVHLSRFETRKIIFDSQALNTEKIEKALLDAVHFELLWLLNKRDFYSLITNEDDKRIKMLNDRWKILNESK